MSTKSFKDWQRRRQRQAEDDLRSVMTTPEGRRLIWRIIHDVSGLKDVNYGFGNQTFFNEGRRSVGQQLDQESARLAPTHYVQMTTEAFSESRKGSDLNASQPPEKDEWEQKAPP